MATPVKTFALEETLSFRPGSILSQVLSGDEKHETTLFCMAAGTAISEHTSARHAQVMVIRGRGTFHLPEKEVALVPGTLICLPPGTTHSLAAAEDTAFLLFLT